MFIYIKVHHDLNTIAISFLFDFFYAALYMNVWIEGLGKKVSSMTTYNEQNTLSYWYIKQ